VTARDALGSTVTSFTDNVTSAIGTNPHGGTLTATKSVAATAGMATFTGPDSLSNDSADVGYKLRASSGVLTDTLSTAFDVVPATATQLAFTVQPVNTTANTAIAPAVEVTAYDAQGNKATNFNGDVTVAIDADPVGGSQLGGTKTVTAINGVATFSTLTIDQVGSRFKLNAAFFGSPPVVASALFDTP